PHPRLSTYRPTFSSLSLHDALPIYRISIIFQEPMTALSPLHTIGDQVGEAFALHRDGIGRAERHAAVIETLRLVGFPDPVKAERDRKSTRLNSSHQIISYAVFFLSK